MLFSQRRKIKPVKTVIQTDSMDIDLRNGLWNCIYITYFQNMDYGYNYELIIKLTQSLWLVYFKRPLDEIPNPENFIKIIKSYFFDHAEWDDVYSFVEFIANYYEIDELNHQFMDCCNMMLQGELSGYRFIGGKITPVTSDVEIDEIENALENSSNYVYVHLNRALELLTDKKHPDYRNSIKESISAVESICKTITGDDKATLGRALKKIEVDGKIEIHEKLRTSFKELYGYTSDSGGIRHSIKDSGIVEFEDAQFMLTTCSAFINYLIAKASKSSINLK